MANQYQSSALVEQVRLHGEMLAKLTAIVDQDHEDLEELKRDTAVIAKVVAARETRETVKADIKSKIISIGIPLAASLVGVLAGHFIR